MIIFLCIDVVVTCYNYLCRNKSDQEYYNDPRSYPICCWMPFTVLNYSMFAALWTLKFSTLFIAISIYLIIDTYMFGAIFVIGVQFDLLTESLIEIERSIDTGQCHMCDIPHIVINIYQ